MVFLVVCVDAEMKPATVVDGYWRAIFPVDR